MKISIIIPNYNKAQFIKETIDSVLNQDYTDYEIIIIDDHSTDDSWNLIKQLESKEKKVEAFKPLIKLGGSGCRNLGIEKAKGEYIIFLDSDDVFSANCLSLRISFIAQNPENNFWVFNTGTFYNTIGDSNSKWIPPKSGYLQRFLKHDLPWNIMALVWKTEFLVSLDGFDESYPRLQDVELHTRALINTDKFLVNRNEEITSFYRISESRTTGSKEELIQKQYEGVNKFYKDFFYCEQLSKSKHYVWGTIFSFTNSLNYNFKKNLISKKFYDEFIQNIIIDITPPCINKVNIHFLKLYNKLYQLGFYNIKGFNFIMKNLALHLFKISSKH